MDSNMAKQILKEYVFAEFEIKSLYKFVSNEITDELEKKLTAETLLSKAIQKGIISLSKETEKRYSEMNNSEIKKITYETCPIKCTSCNALCNEMSVEQCRKNLSEKLDKK